MLDSIPCWRCKRLPHTAVEQTNQQPLAEPTIEQKRPQSQPEVGTGAGYNYEQFQQARHYIPLWLWFTGTVGILLLCGLVLGGAALFLTAEEDTPADDTVAQSDSPMATLPNTATSAATSGTANNVATTPAPSATGITPSFSGSGQTSTEQNRTTTPPLATNTLPPNPANTSAPDTTTQNAAPGAFGDAVDNAGGAAPAQVNGNGNPTDLPAPTAAPSQTPTIAPTLTPIICPGTVLPRLSNGDTAEVVIGNTIRVRDTAGLAGSVVMNIGTGDSVSITGNPICTDGYLWWPVTMSDGQRGWVAEGSNTQYFLEPR